MNSERQSCDQYTMYMYQLIENFLTGGHRDIGNCTPLMRMVSNRSYLMLTHIRGIQQN